MNQLNENIFSKIATKLLIFLVSGKSIKNIESRYKENPDLVRQFKETKSEIDKLKSMIEDVEKGLENIRKGV